MEDTSKFKLLTDDMYELYESCKTSGLDDQQAFELTKTYCSVAFVHQAFTYGSSYRSKEETLEKLRKYVGNRKDGGEIK